jgi:uncharacterized protein (DUF885 family)
MPSATGTSPFAALLDRFLEEYFQADPIAATQAGIHEHDDRWPDWTDAGQAAHVAWIDRWTNLLAGLGGNLSDEEALDRDRLLLVLAEERYLVAELREDTWNPLDWVYRMGGGLYLLLSGTFAPPLVRLASVVARLEGLPDVSRAALSGLGSVPDLPVSRFHTETAIGDLAGVGVLIDEALELGAATADEPGGAALASRLEQAAAGAREAIGELSRALSEEVLPRSRGEGRLGRERFDAKASHIFSDPAMTADRILAEAERQFVSVRAEMVRIARELWPAWVGDGAPPTDDAAAVRGVLDAIARDHPAAPDLLTFCREEVVRIEAFCRERDVVGLAEEPLEIRWTPVFLRSFGGAMLHTPGPFDKGERAFYSITPPADDWPPERVESFLRENNSRLLRLITIHEAVPGHYLQGVYNNRSTLTRGVFSSGVYAEGWAVYVTQVMMDLGYDAEDPALLLTHWKYYLRCVVNAIIDVRIHTAAMTEAEALDLMIDGGFQEAAEARAKYNRARLTATQLSTYFVGSNALWALEAEVRSREAAESRASQAGARIPEPAIVGGYGATPGFVYREHLERVLRQGSLPIPLLRRALLGD